MEILNPYGFIYITTNMVNGMKYIGQRKFMTTRSSWQKYLGSGVALDRAFKKYGKENFIREIVAIVYSQEELDNLEVEFIKNHNAVESDDYYNIAKGGKTGYTGNPFVNKTKEEMVEYKKHMSEIRKGNLNPGWKGGKKIKKVSIYKSKYNLNGVKRSYTLGEKNGMYGKKHTQETKEKMSIKRQGSDNANSKKVICITTGEIFDCMIDAVEKCNLKATSSISQCLHGKQKTAGKLDNGTKLEWKFYL